MHSAQTGPVRECRNTPFAGAEAEATLRWRERLAHTLRRGRTGLHGDDADQARRELLVKTTPMTAYQTLFVEKLDPYIVQGVSRMYADARADGSDHRGFVYVFREPRDPPDVYKIGRTSQADPRVRVAQWNADLNGAAVLLFAEPTDFTMLTEAVLHRLLLCQWLPRLVTDSRTVTEYFRVPDLPALRLLVQAVAQFTNAHMAQP